MAVIALRHGLRGHVYVNEMFVIIIINLGVGQMPNEPRVLFTGRKHVVPHISCTTCKDAACINNVEVTTSFMLANGEGAVAAE